MNFTDLKTTDKTYFHMMVEVTRNIIFRVSYYKLGSNKNARFSTSANELNRPKNNYKSCGQAQEYLLPQDSKVRAFYEKWDNLHLSDLNEAQYTNLLEDLEVLNAQYNTKYFDDTIDDIPFYEVVKFSKLPLKHKLTA